MKKKKAVKKSVKNKPIKQHKKAPKLIKKTKPAKQKNKKAIVKSVQVAEQLYTPKIKEKTIQQPNHNILGFEEITVICSNCGKKFKMIKYSGLNVEGSLCQRCSLSTCGVAIEKEED